MKRSLSFVLTMAVSGSALAADLPKMKLKYDKYCEPKLEEVAKDYEFKKKQHENFIALSKKAKAGRAKAAVALHADLAEVDAQVKKLDLPRLFKDYKAGKIGIDVVVAAANKIMKPYNEKHDSEQQKEIEVGFKETQMVYTGKPIRVLQFIPQDGSFVIGASESYEDEVTFKKCMEGSKGDKWEPLKCHQERYVDGYVTNLLYSISFPTPGLSVNEIEKWLAVQDAFKYEEKKFPAFDDYALARIDHQCFPDVALKEKQTNKAEQKLDDALKETCEQIFVLYRMKYLGAVAKMFDEPGDGERLSRAVAESDQVGFQKMINNNPGCAGYFNKPIAGTHVYLNLSGRLSERAYQNAFMDNMTSHSTHFEKCRELCKEQSDCCAVEAVTGGYSDNEKQTAFCKFYSSVDGTFERTDKKSQQSAWVGPKCVTKPVMKPSTGANSKTSENYDKKTKSQAGSVKHPGKASGKALD